AGEHPPTLFPRRLGLSRAPTAGVVEPSGPAEGSRRPDWLCHQRRAQRGAGCGAAAGAGRGLEDLWPGGGWHVAAVGGGGLRARGLLRAEEELPVEVRGS